jgi:hypothetical protein
VEAWDVGERSSQLASDLEKGLKGRVRGPSRPAVKMARALVDEARRRLPNDPILAAIDIPEDPTAADLIGVLRQVERAMPSRPPVFA